MARARQIDWAEIERWPREEGKEEKFKMLRESFVGEGN
jgi:hypothetical protein